MRRNWASDYVVNNPFNVVVNASEGPIQAGTLYEFGMKELGAMSEWRIDEAETVVVGVFRGPRAPDAEFNYGHMGIQI